MKSESKLLNIPLYLMEPFMSAMLGTSMVRETQKNIEKAGFKIEKVENLFFDIVRLIIATKPSSNSNKKQRIGIELIPHYKCMLQKSIIYL